MSIIEVEGVSKRYRKGVTGYRTLREDLYSLTGRLVHLRRHRPEDIDSKHIWALSDVSFQVQRGERVGIIGRNGSGKTTLLRLLAGVTQATRGRITVGGRMGVLIEITAGFHPELTGRENIYLNGAIMGMSQREIRRKFDDIVEFADLKDWVDTPLKRYSSGMHVRLGFAVAAHLDPDVLLVDEVLAVGDVAFQNKCLGKMETAASEGRTVLLVSHNMATVAGFCDRCILLDSSRLCADGPASEVIERYLEMSGAVAAEGVPGEYDLTRRENSYTPGKLMVRRLRLLNPQGGPQSAFLMGQGMTVAIDVEDIADCRDAVIGAIFKSDGGQRVAGISTAMTGVRVESPRSPREQAVLRIPQVPFLPGRYWLDVSITRGRSGRIDYVDRAAQFTVVEGDVYGTGYHLSADYGVVYLQGSWEIRRNA